MMQRYRTVMWSAFAIGALSGCAATKAPSVGAFQPVALDPAGFTKKADTFVVVLDASSSMNDNFGGRDKFDIARETIARFNATVPALDYEAGLLSFGSGHCVGGETSKVLYGPAAYRRADLDAGLAKQSCASGFTPMQRGLAAAHEELAGTKGRIALIVVGDATRVSDKGVLGAAGKLKSDFGDKLCIYPVQVGDDANGKMLMDELADVTGCGFATNAKDIADPNAMAGYVTKVLLTPAAKPAPAPVAAAPAVIGDADGDGVKDDKDKCPNTPKGIRVNSVGCWVLEGVYFDTDKAIIKDAAAIDHAISVFKAEPKLSAEIQGHTDDRASDKHNQKLSEARAKAVRDYMIQGGIAADRLRAKGYGESKPIAPNDTDEGRAQNRRVEIQPDK